jgi:TolB protein
MRTLMTLFIAISFLWGADATIEVTKRVDALPSIAVEDASVDYRGGISKEFFRALVSDLNVLALFNVDNHYTENRFNSSSVHPANEKFEYVLRFRLVRDDNGALLADAKLIKSGSVLMNKRYRISSTKKHIFLSHYIAYDVNDAMGAPAVDWMKRKLILARLVAPGRSEILIADYTLNYQHVMIRGGLNIFPKWADPQQESFYFTDLDHNVPALYKMSTRTGKSVKVASSDGMIVCSDVSRDGRELLVTMAPGGQPDIYHYDTRTKKMTRETRYSGIDVSGQFMEDGRIAFVSNRMGYPNIYAKTLGASGVQQMVHYGKSNSACSAHNEYIVYKARESHHAFSANTFNLHLISTKTDFIRRLTATGVNEFPRFSEDGDAIVFVKHYRNQSAVGIIRLAQNKNYLFPLNIGKIQSLDW